MAVQNRDGVEPVGVGDPTCAARGDSRQAPADVVAAAQLGFFGDKKAQKGAPDIPEADDREVIRRNGLIPSRSGVQDNSSDSDVDFVGAQHAAPLQGKFLMCDGSEFCRRG